MRGTCVEDGRPDVGVSWVSEHLRGADTSALCCCPAHAANNPDVWWWASWAGWVGGCVSFNSIQQGHLATFPYESLLGALLRVTGWQTPQAEIPCCVSPQSLCVGGTPVGSCLCSPGHRGMG